MRRAVTFQERESVLLFAPARSFQAVGCGPVPCECEPGAYGISGFAGLAGYVGENWIEKAAREVREALERAGSAVQTAASNLSTQVQAFGANVARQAEQAGRSLESQLARADAHVQAQIKTATKNVLAKINAVVHPSPLARVAAYLTLPPPLGFVAAYKYVSAHKSEVIAALPSEIRDRVRTMESGISEMDSLGERPAGVSGYWTSPQAEAAIRRSTVPGIYRFWALTSPYMDRISDAWYHKLGAWGRRGLIALLIVLVVLTVIVVYYSGTAGLKAALHGDWQVIVTSFKAFANAVGYTQMIGYVSALITFVSGGSAPPPPPPPPDPVSSSATGTALATMPPDPANPGLPSDTEGAWVSGGSLAAFALLGAL